MRRFFSTISETFLLLRRDKVFLPVIVVIICIVCLAALASSWGTQDYKKILYDIGTTGIDITGALVAIFWGTKLIADSKKEGSLELQLAAPVSRSQWVIGKFIGLTATLLFLCMTMLVFWQAILLMNGLGWMEKKHLIIFLLQPVGWTVLAALAVCLASMTSQMTAMFSSLCLWILGLTSVSISESMHPDTAPAIKSLIRQLAHFWDFQKFNLSEYANLKPLIASEEIVWRACYGLTLSLLLVSIAAVLFTRKDVASE